MSNKKTRPRLCVVFFPPYDQKLGRRPHGILMARTSAETLREMMVACAQSLPHRELTRARGVGSFFVGHETSFDATREASEYTNLVTWSGTDHGGHYLEFVRGLVAPFFESKQAA